MIATIACPTCQFKFSIPEGEMGKQRVCPNCQAPFLAGKSTAEPRIAENPMLAPHPAAYQRTMLGDTGSAIKYNCPRCKAALEAPSIEAGTKKPCPACGQRLQVPAAPPAAADAASQPNLNRTMLAGDDSTPAAPPIKYNCPSCKVPLESPASEANTKKPCPACGQRLQVPAAPPLVMPDPSLNRTRLASDESNAQPIVGQILSPMPATPGAAPAAPAGTITIGSYTMSTRAFVLGTAAAALFLLVVIPAVMRGGRAEDVVAVAALKKELERANAEVELRKADVERMGRLELETREQIKMLYAKLSEQEHQMRENHREALRGITDQALRAEKERKFAEEERRLAKAKEEQEKAQLKLLQESEAARKKSEDELAKARQQQQTIIATPPPYYYHRPWHWGYYYPW